MGLQDKLLRRENPFSESSLGKLVAVIAQFPHRPSDLVGYKGSKMARLLFDIEVLTKSPLLQQTSLVSTKDKIKGRRRELGIV